MVESGTLRYVWGDSTGICRAVRTSQCSWGPDLLSEDRGMGQCFRMEIGALPYETVSFCGD